MAPRWSFGGNLGLARRDRHPDYHDVATVVLLVYNVALLLTCIYIYPSGHFEGHNMLPQIAIRFELPHGTPDVRLFCDFLLSWVITMAHVLLLYLLATDCALLSRRAWHLLRSSSKKPFSIPHGLVLWIIA